MKKTSFVLLILVVLNPALTEQKNPSVNIEDLTWLEAEKILKTYEVVLIALGAWGDLTLATREKGEIIVETTVQEIIKEIQELINLKIE